MKLKALFNAVIVEQIEEDESTYGSIVVPDMGKEKPEMGEVLAIGPGRYTETGQLNAVRSCKVGDVVLVPKIGTLRIDFEGEEFYIAQDREVLAVVKKESNQED